MAAARGNRPWSRTTAMAVSGVLLGGLAWAAPAPAAAPAAPVSASAGLQRSVIADTLPAAVTRPGLSGKPRKVRVQVATAFIYDRQTGETFVTGYRVRKVTAKQVGGRVLVKRGRSWVRAPYAWDAARKALVLDARLLVDRGIADPFGTPTQLPAGDAPADGAPADGSPAPEDPQSETAPAGLVPPLTPRTMEGLDASHAGSFAPLATAANGQPARWDSCTASLTWGVDPVSLPPAADLATEIAAWEAVFGHLAQVTGFSFSRVDATGLAAVDASGSPRMSEAVDIVIGYASASGSAGPQYALPGLGGDVAGVGGTFHYAEDGRVVSGYVYIDRDDWAGLGGLSSAELLYPPYLHEVGHAMGLGHVGDDSQTMFASLVSERTGYGAGDQAGLRAFKALPCF